MVIKKARQVQLSNIKVMLTKFFDFNIIVLHEFLSQGQTITKEYYLQIKCRLHAIQKKKLPDIRKNNARLLHHDNAPAYITLLVREFLAKNHILILIDWPCL